MRSWADVAAGKTGKTPADSSCRPSSPGGPAAPTTPTPKILAPVAEPPAKAVTNESQDTEESNSILQQHQSVIKAINQAAQAAPGSSDSSSFQGLEQTLGGQQGPEVMISTDSASTSGPGNVMAGRRKQKPSLNWGSNTPHGGASGKGRGKGRGSAPGAALPGPPAPAPRAPRPLPTRTAPVVVPPLPNGGCTRCGTPVTPQGHAPHTYLCDRDPRYNPVNILWPTVAAPLKQAAEDEWLKDLFDRYCWRGDTVTTPPARTLPPTGTTALTPADITARNSKTTFTPKLSQRLNDKVSGLANGQLQPEDCHEIRRAFNVNAPGNPTVLTNHLRIANVPDEFWKYDVQFQPALSPNTTAKKKRVLLETMIKRMAFLIENGPRQTNNPVLFSHDNHGTIFATTDLYPIAAAAAEDHVTLALAPLTNTWTAQTFIPSARSSPTSGNGVIGIGLQGQRGPANVDLRLFRQMVSGDVLSQHQHVSNISQALNTLVADSACVPKAFAHFDTFQIGANKFFLCSQFTPLQGTHVLQLHDGFSVTVKPAMGDALLNFNSATSAFYCPLNVATYLRQVAPPINAKPVRGLQGLRVYINYLRGQPVPIGAPPLDINRRERRIKTIFAIGGPQGQTIGAQTFMPGAHSGYPTLNATLPYGAASTVINVGSVARPEYYAAEHLDILPFQPWKGLLPGNLGAGMVTQAARFPADNKTLIVQRGLGALGIARGAVSTIVNPNFRIEGKLLSVPVRYIPAPAVTYSNGHPANGNVGHGNWKAPPRWRHRKSEVTAVAILYHNNFSSPLLTRLKTEMRTSTGRNEISYTDIPFNFRSDANVATFDSAIRNGCGKKPDFVIFINPWHNEKPPYDAFRISTDINLGVPSICITENKLINGDRNQNPNVFRGIVSGNALKVNSRFRNGINQSVNLTLPGAANMSNTIILGADVAHPGQGSKGAGSIAALVGTRDNTGLTYGGSARPNYPRQEWIDDFDEMLQERLEGWRVGGRHATWPQNVLYFRDGVSESQYSEIRRREVNHIKAVYAANGQTIVPNIMAVVVTKRHNTRFYPVDGGQNANNGNTIPGTCVESEVTHPYYNDFFLQSHAAIKGTAKPTHYFILQDDLAFSPNQLQTFIHNLCHAYQRSTTSVSYATPAYYADRLCDRVRRYFSGWYNKSYPDPRQWNPTDEAGGYARFRTEWRGGRPLRANPWEGGLDDGMFWL
ncbi:hypothetical protein BLS_003657 [Venturia inaequalis]|uniref:Piwi domain-containing protein n=1 Tax=Venturia inaequalis TaxID=5025 RepID=A0A8H3UPG9_VENIN|nr:hypothetical protein BLS_003657 [Venturia inaequalis]